MPTFIQIIQLFDVEVDTILLPTSQHKRITTFLVWLSTSNTQWRFRHGRGQTS